MIIQVGVKAFLKNSEGKYLLVHRSSEKYKNTKGSWDIVGGRIEPGASLLENLKREVEEETGLKILSEPKLVYVQDIMPDTEKHIVRISYVADSEGEVVLDEKENFEYKWLTLDEILAQEDLDIYVKEILEKGILK